MKKIALLSLATFFLWSCTTSPSEEKKEEEKVEEITVEAVPEERALVNPNRASLEELIAISGISEATATVIIENRPYLDMTAFDSQLTSQAAELDKEAVYNQLFVPININTAAESEFKLVPGVGNKMAHEFEEYRPYLKVDQFRREIGKYVDEKEVARYERFVFVPVDLNTATDDQILSIPGVGQKMLHEFKEYRPYTSMDQFRREIGKYVSEDEVALFERYVQIIED